jgi:hypothetical protein
MERQVLRIIGNPCHLFMSALGTKFYAQ